MIRAYLINDSSSKLSVAVLNLRSTINNRSSRATLHSQKSSFLDLFSCAGLRFSATSSNSLLFLVVVSPLAGHNQSTRLRKTTIGQCAAKRSLGLRVSCLRSHWRCSIRRGNYVRRIGWDDLQIPASAASGQYTMKMSVGSDQIILTVSVQQL